MPGADLYPTLAVPFCTWIMIGYFSSIPKELDEAALIDGAGYLQMLLQDLHPGGDARHHRRDDLRLHRELGRSSSIRWPISTRSNQMVLTVGIISDLIRGDVFQWGKIMAAACWRRCRRSSSTPS